MKWFLLIIVIALAAVSWTNRDKISSYVRHQLADSPTPAPGAPVTPNPAAESVAQARKAYPALAVANSPFNRKFIELYNNARLTNPDSLTSPDWPMLLAAQTARELSSPIPSAVGLPPTELSGSPLNGRPLGSAPGYTVPPSVQLPGLKGSSLDQRPMGRGAPAH